MQNPYLCTPIVDIYTTNNTALEAGKSYVVNHVRDYEEGGVVSIAVKEGRVTYVNVATFVAFFKIQKK